MFSDEWGINTLSQPDDRLDGGSFFAILGRLIDLVQIVKFYQFVVRKTPLPIKLYQSRNEEIRLAVSFDYSNDALACRHHSIHIETCFRAQSRRSYNAASAAGCQRIDGLT